MRPPEEKRPPKSIEKDIKKIEHSNFGSLLFSKFNEVIYAYIASKISKQLQSIYQ